MMDKKDYLDISKASDLKDHKDRILYRALEMIPGIISLGTLAGVLVLSYFLPGLVAIFIIIFCFFYLIRVLYFSLHNVLGYFRVKNHIRKDWLKELKKTKTQNWKDIYHLVVLPTYKEGANIVEETIDAILASEYPKEKIMVVLAIEERAGSQARQMAQVIEKKYSDKFFKFLISEHPANIPGEIGGKGSNTAWAAKQSRKLIDSLQIPYENILVSTFDIDTKVYPGYFACVTWYYLNQENRERASYQPVPIYNNNN